MRNKAYRDFVKGAGATARLRAERFVSDAEADKMLSREYRKPWSL